MYLFKNFYKINQNLLNIRFIIFLIFIALFLSRGAIYRSIIQYRIREERIADTRIDQYIERYILTHHDVYDRKFDDIRKIALVALKVTADALSFEGEASLRSSPLSTWHSGYANSEGYATFFNTVTNYLITRHHLSDRYVCHQYRAERVQKDLNLQEIYYSPYENHSPFNKYRDVVAIEDIETGQRFFVDPVIYEQVNIVYIKVLSGGVSINGSASSE